MLNEETRQQGKDAELAFTQEAQGIGWTVLRQGWPDYLCSTPDGHLLAVEVKSGNAPISKHQRQVLSMLSTSIPCYVYHPDSGLTHWNERVSLDTEPANVSGIRIKQVTPRHAGEGQNGATWADALVAERHRVLGIE